MTRWGFANILPEQFHHEDKMLEGWYWFILKNLP